MTMPQMPRLAAGPGVTDDTPTEQIEARYRLTCVHCGDHLEQRHFSNYASKSDFARRDAKEAGWVWRKQRGGWWCDHCVATDKHTKKERRTP